MSLAVTGSIGIDTIHAPTGHAERILGGSCTYFAAAASFYGLIRVIAAVGDDWPQSHADLLGKFDNIDLAGLEHRKGSKTFSWTGKYHDNMNIRETLFVEQGVLAEEPPPVPQQFCDTEYLFLANDHPVSQLKLLESFSQPKLVVADTMDLWLNTEFAALEKILFAVDGLIINDSEAEHMTRCGNSVCAARLICDKYNLKFVIVKKGEHGSILMHKDGIAVLPAYPAETVVDPTGAGDSFAGGFMGYITKQDKFDFLTLQKALAHGTIMASFTIESFSLERLVHLTTAELDHRMRQFAEAVSV